MHCNRNLIRFTKFNPKKGPDPVFEQAKMFQQISPLCWDIFLILMYWGVAKLIPSNHLCEGPYSLSLIEKRKTQTYTRKLRTYTKCISTFCHYNFWTCYKKSRVNNWRTLLFYWKSATQFFGKSKSLGLHTYVVSKFFGQ